MQRIYISEKWYGANLFYPERIILTQTSIIHEWSNGLFGFLLGRIEIPIRNINRVITTRNLLGCTIQIIFHGSNALETQTVTAHNFHWHDVVEISKLLNR